MDELMSQVLRATSRMSDLMFQQAFTTNMMPMHNTMEGVKPPEALDFERPLEHAGAQLTCRLPTSSGSR